MKNFNVNPQILIFDILFIVNSYGVGTRFGKFTVYAVLYKHI